MNRQTHAIVVKFWPVQTQSPHAASSVIRTAVQGALLVVRLPLAAFRLLMELFAVGSRILGVQKGEHCDAYQKRGLLIGTDVVQPAILAVVRIGSS